MTSLDISVNSFMGHPWKDINLYVHFKFDVLINYFMVLDMHILKLHLYILYTLVIDS